MQDFLPAGRNTGPRSLECQASHFTLHYFASSPSERDIRLLAARLDAMHAALTAVLGLQGKLDGRTDVHLVDAEDEDWVNGRPPTAEDADIYCIYRADTPAEELERVVLARLLGSAVGERAGQPSPLFDGVFGFIGERARGHDSARVDKVIAGHLKEGTPVRLADLLRGPDAMERRCYAPAAVSFAAWLLSSFGAEAVKRALHEQESSGLWGSSITAVTGKSLDALEHAWHAALRRRFHAPLGVRGYLRGVYRHIKAHPLQAGAAMLLTIPAFAFEVLHPIVYALIVDEGILHKHTELIPKLTTLLVVLILVQGVGSFMRERMFARLGYKISSNLRYRVFEHLQRLGIDFYARSSASDVSSHVNGTLDEVEETIIETFPQVVARFYTLAAWIGLLFYFEWRIGIFSLFVLPLAWLGPRIIGPRVERAAEEQRGHAEHVAGTVHESIANQPVVKAFGLHRRATGLLRGQLQSFTHSAVRTRSANGMLETVTELGGSTFFVAAIAMGAWLAAEGKTTVGALVASLDLMVYIVPNIRTLFSGTLPPMQEGAHALAELEELLDEEPGVQDRADARPLLGSIHSVRFENVTFSYTGEQVSLDGLDLEASRGRFVGVAGTSGSGKSTVISLLLRFYDPMLGCVTVDGQDLRSLTQESLRAQIGTVFQDTVLFSTTIRENIRAGSLNATDSDVEAAAKHAEIHDFIVSLPQKYDTIIGERGHRLSGGQRQRIAIARALLRDPAVLLLDEATSSLDAETENAVMETVRQAAAGRIVIAVTHQLSTVRDADHIVVLDRGRMIEHGTHESLLTGNGLYARLWQQQGLTTDTGGDTGAREATDERLRSVAMFRSLDQAALAALAGRVASERFEPGEVVFSQGDPADKLYLVTQGQVEVVATDATGGERVTAVLAAGDAFGEMALRREEPRTTTVRARTGAHLLSLERAQILKSAADVLNLPDEDRALVTWLMRHGESSASQAAAFTGQDDEAARATLDGLVARGYVQEVERDGQLHFRARLAAKRGKQLSKNIWQALDGKKSA